MQSCRVVINVTFKHAYVHCKFLAVCFVCFFFAEYIWIFILTLELSKWLEPLEKVRFEIGSISTLVDYIKQVQISQS